MIKATPTATGETDTGARAQLTLLLVSALVWLLANGVFALVTTIQLYSPSFLADCPFLTYGRAQAIQETIFIYGWAANAAFALSLWILGRLGGVALRGLGLLTVGTIFWNVGVVAGLGCIAVGEATSVRFLQMPVYIHPLLLVAYGAIATPGILAWIDRRAERTFAAQWYIVAALFLFPWFYSAAQVMLLAAPVHGVAHPVIANWFGQNLLLLWLLPVGIGAAYYLVPKITGRVLSHYEFAPHGFWTLIFFGSLIGARHLVGGPVPAWIPTLAIVCASLLLFHYLVIALNLPAGLAGGKGSAALGFVSFGLVCYLLGGLADALFSFQHFAAALQYTFFPLAQLKLALVGGFSFLAFGAIYFLGSQISGREWPSSGLVRGHFLLSVLGTLLTVIGLAGAGYQQGHGLLDTAMSFGAIAAATKPWLMATMVGELLFFLGSAAFAVNFVRLTAASYGVSYSAVSSSATLGAPAS